MGKDLSEMTLEELWELLISLTNPICCSFPGLSEPYFSGKATSVKVIVRISPVCCPGLVEKYGEMQ